MKTRTLLLLFALTIINLNVFSQPTNDNPCGATAVTVNGGCFQGDNTGATYSGEPNASCISENNTVWFSFVATDDSMTVTTDFASLGELTLTDTQIAVFSSSDNTCTGSFTELGCDDDSGEGCNYCSTLVFTTLTVSNTYFVMVDGYSTSTGTFCLSAFETPPPKPNFGTTCELAHQMYSNNTCYDLDAGNNGDHTMSVVAGIDQSCSAANDATQNGFWSKFTAVDASITVDPVDFKGASTSDWYDISIYTGSCGSLTEFNCTSVASKDNSYSVSGLTVGQEYYILMTAGSNYSGNLARLSICGASACTTPSNNACGSALDISSGGTFEGTTACATPDLGLCSGSTENNIWFSWTAPADWPIDSAAFFYLWNQDCYGTSSTTGGTQVSIYHTSETCATIGGDSSECIVYTNPNDQNNFFANFIPVANATYLINLDGFGGEACTFNVTVSQNAPVPTPLSLIDAKLYTEKEGKDVVLKWHVMGDNQLGDYVIERSSDGVIFSTIAYVNHKKYDVNAIDYRVYRYKDDEPLKGKSYYRISKKEEESKFILTNIVAVEFNASSVDIFPNPVNSDEFNVSIFKDNAGAYSVLVSDISGRKIYSYSDNGTKGENVVHINIPMFPSGVYVLRVLEEDVVYTTKFVKE